MSKIITTVCLIHESGKLLLGRKKRGFAEGKWNGFGGKVGEGKSLEEAAKREMQEECGLVIQEMELVGVLDAEFVGKDETMEVNIFKVTKYSGEPQETEEMRPEWFAVESLPFDQMWPDDTYWMPYFLSDKKFTGTFKYDGYSSMLNHTLKEVVSLQTIII